MSPGMYGVLKTDNLVLLHIRLDILTMFLKILEQDLTPSLKDVLELVPSTASPQEYLMEWVFDLIVSDRSLCSCYSILWLLLIRYGERVSCSLSYISSSGLEGMVQISSHQFGSSLEVVLSQLFTVDMRRIWGATGKSKLPFCRHNFFFICSLQQHSTAPTSRFSTAAWIIRNHLLGDTPPPEESIRHALESILALQMVWGANVEVVHSLWLYFSRKLVSFFSMRFRQPLTNHLLFPAGLTVSLFFFRIQDSMVDLRPKDSKSGGADLHPFTLFCDITVQVFISHSTDVLNLIRVALPSLTRQGIANYFTLIECLLRAVLSPPQNQKVACELMGFVVSLFGGMEEAQLKWFCDWEIGRRCAALEALQNLLVIGFHNDSTVNREFEQSLTHLVHLTCRFREAIVQQVKSNTMESGANVLNFTLLGHRDKLEQLALSFCQSLLPPLLRRTEWISQLFDAPLLDTLCSSVRGEWLSFLHDLLSSHCRDNATCPSTWKGKLASFLECNSPYRTSSLLGRLWSDVLPHFLSRACTNASWAEEAAEVAQLFLHLALASSSNMSPWDLLSWFSFKTNLSFSFRRLYFRRLFNDTGFLNTLLRSQITPTDVNRAWQFYTTWLTYSLLDDANECRKAISLHAIGCELPDGVSTLVDTAVAEISLLQLCQRFEAVETFQERMAFKSETLRRLTPLAQLLSSIMERFLTASTPSEVEITAAYRATASLFQTASPLLYSPDGIFTSLFDAFLLPPWRRLTKETSIKKSIVQTCVAENLPAFLRGILQLNYQKDPFIARMLRELLRTIFFSVGIKYIASAVQMCDLSTYRAHLLRVLAQEFISHLDEPSNGWNENAKMWMDFFDEMDKGTVTLVQALRDAPYLLWPVAALLGDTRNAKSFTSLTNRCASAFATFITRWKSLKSTMNDGVDGDAAR
ncbi:unnamed protein product [Hydatigera taeniaeformis]|uniref:MMS22L_C domain-containing protein n=1 Tax=Hydatigena taeniaeformis TaxID=6205 RepID=A0A158RDQ8_HYDTA|nr:unnamed protein product [Hydatigera taeniaeformis]